ncbi:PREDICTED: uncharacterized protein LOC107101304 [Cyprinodon variegatus]|uniref:uncharacterized protein LOC107101304 n=1 Tax=Cyprinodon variegatus TaxID=28743 RepID=UPI000742BBA9|nr:PREDICTED: uncharacterized protein LOC107101304 [Cyprinodon variegatus]XP_015255657.1 PREDICTED: uncharacterized protein LOC107101304 [Cyprinodon variegatus]
METILAPLVFYLLLMSFQKAHTENLTLFSTTDLNLTEFSTTTASFDSTGTQTEETDTYTSTNPNNQTFTTTLASTENTSEHQTPQSATTMTSSTKLPTTQSSASSTQTSQTTTAFISTPDTPESSTVNSTHSVTTYTYPPKTTEGLKLNISERNLTIIFSGMLGLFALATVMIMLYKCKHKLQYLHQPLHTTDDTDGFTVDEDTLVISGGLYDGHPIYDNLPPPHEEQSQFRLEFRH